MAENKQAGGEDSANDPISDFCQQDMGYRSEEK
jgi:hypothetical protein